MPGSDAQAAWEQLVPPASTAGWWPVILDSDGLSNILEAAQSSEVGPADAIRNAAGIDVNDWLRERADALGLRDADDGSHPDSESVTGVDLAIVRNVLTGKFLPEVSIAMVRVPRSADIAGELLYGCWNDNPCPAEHVAVLRRWEDQFGAHVASMGSIVELTVDRPPASWKDAMALAQEMYVYDYDIVDQGTNSTNALAAVLLNSPQWYFWWD